MNYVLHLGHMKWLRMGKNTLELWITWGSSLIFLQTAFRIRTRPLKNTGVRNGNVNFASRSFHMVCCSNMEQRKGDAVVFCCCFFGLSIFFLVLTPFISPWSPAFSKITQKKSYGWTKVGMQFGCHGVVLYKEKVSPPPFMFPTNMWRLSWSLPNV